MRAEIRTLALLSLSILFVALASPIHAQSGPTITSVSPGHGPVGTVVTITGTNYGATQGASTVKFNGVTATPSSWGSTQIVAPLPAGATAGNLVVTVSAAPSNGVSFTVVAPPTITASVSPAPNAGGWNNTSVLVSFSCQAGGLPLATGSCSSPQTVATEGTNQQVTGTVSDTSGNSASTSVLLKIDKTIPTLSITSPNDGTTFTSSSLTLSGSASDGFSGLSGVTCNGAAVSVVSGVFSCNISLNPGVNLVVVRATDLADNVSAGLLHLSLDAPLPAPTSLQITPSGVNMLVGETQQFTAVDQLGGPRADATWSVSDTSLASLCLGVRFES